MSRLRISIGQFSMPFASSDVKNMSDYSGTIRLTGQRRGNVPPRGVSSMRVTDWAHGGVTLPTRSKHRELLLRRREDDARKRPALAASPIAPVAAGLNLCYRCGRIPRTAPNGLAVKVRLRTDPPPISRPSCTASASGTTDVVCQPLSDGGIATNHLDQRRDPRLLARSAITRANAASRP